MARRRLARAPIEIFSISFLDIISCAFGAVVMLVLLAKNGDQDSERGPDNLSILIDQVLAAQTYVEQLQGALSDKQDALEKAQSVSSSVTLEKANYESAVPRAMKTLQQLKEQATALRQEIRVAQARLNAPVPAEEPDDEVGGIPTDAEYVVFVIDNSGSMSGGSGWNNVTDVVSDILKSHPKMKGFQVMAADGSHLYRGQEGQWLSDSDSMRSKAIKRMSSFRGGGSAPEVGIMQAIQLYGNTRGRVSLYVFGDDYRPANLDRIVSQITTANTDANGKTKVRIHGVGFNRLHGNPEMFAAFMQALAKRNRGAFVGLYF